MDLNMRDPPPPQGIHIVRSFPSFLRTHGEHFQKAPDLLLLDPLEKGHPLDSPLMEFVPESLNEGIGRHDPLIHQKVLPPHVDPYQRSKAEKISQDLRELPQGLLKGGVLARIHGEVPKGHRKETNHLLG
jgi:hypothetical protein